MRRILGAWPPPGGVVEVCKTMSLEFTGNIWYWHGPSPFHFVTMPEAECKMIKDVSKLVTYGWGMIPVAV